MLLFCCYTRGHEVLLHEHFEPSIPEGFTLQAHFLPIAGRGDFFSPEFLECIARKLDLILASLHAHPGEILAWFFKNARPAIPPTLRTPDKLLSSRSSIMPAERQRLAIGNANLYRKTALIDSMLVKTAARPAAGVT